MNIRYGINNKDIKNYDTNKLREELHVDNIFENDKINFTYSHIDRIIFGGIKPINKKLSLDKFDSQKTLGSNFFLERREMGIINIGAKGIITVDGMKYELDNLDALYIGKDSKKVVFESCVKDTPAKFYIACASAHHKYPTTFIKKEDANPVKAGAKETCNERTLYQYLHPNVLSTCQLLMGCTILEKGSVWNTMPCHTHDRRMEVYMYFDVTKNDVVFHLMGEPKETRHIVMKNEECVISPSYSIHSGCGTSNYSFIWAMVGENQTFTDMDAIETKDLL